MNTAAKKDDEFEVETDDEEQFELEIEGDDDDHESAIKKAKGQTDDDDAGDDDDDDEAAEYSERVQKRIKKLTYERHEERRRAEEERAKAEEAFRYAEHTKAEIDRLRKQLEEGQGYAYQQATERLDAQINAAKRELKEAYDTGDSDKIVEAQATLSNLSAEKSRFAGMRPRKKPDEQKPDEGYQPQRAAPQPQRRPTPQAEQWAQRNPWFNRDPRMTAYAFGVHEELITQKGVQPDTEEYYRQIDKEMRKMFPSKFEDASSEDDEPGTVVAPPSRKAPRKPRTVRLNKTQVALAKRLGITPEQYAAELMKGKNNG